LSGNYLVLSSLYWAVCFLIVSLPFVANLNWQRRVRSESLATERQRLRREVHDNVAQTLAFLSLKIQRAEQRAAEGRIAITERDVAEIGSVVERAYLAVRDYLDGADEEGEGPLAANLTSMTGQWSRDTGLPLELSATGEEGELPANTKFQLLQVTKEALANVAKHAYPNHVWVDLECSPEAVTIRVRDDGRGFSAAGIRGHGMGIMSERTSMAGAGTELDISSTLGEGTEVVVSFTREGAREDTRENEEGPR
jgi:signal transduction histidine kinase